MAKKAKTRRTSQVREAVGNEGCRTCPALCCHTLATCIEKPKDEGDIDFYKWHLFYDTVSLAVRSHRWYLVVKGRCIYLDKNNLCTIYDRRPDICRRHNPPDCERFGPWYDTMVNTPEELTAYLAREKERKKSKRAKRKR